jgi:hypothetical protein
MFFISFNSLILKINIKIKNIILIYILKKTLTKSLVRERNGYRKLEYWIRSACPMTRKGTKKDTFLSLSLTFDKDDRHMAHITRFKFLWVFNLWAPQEPREKEEMQQLPFFLFRVGRSYGVYVLRGPYERFRCSASRLTLRRATGCQPSLCFWIARLHGGGEKIPNL